MLINGIDFENVTYKIDLATHSFPDLLESDYIGKIITELASKMGDRFFSYEFIIYSRPTYRKGMPLPTSTFLDKSRKKQIIIYLSDELRFVPDALAANAFAIFKHRLPAEVIRPNIFSIPLGCNRKTKTQAIIPIQQRKFNVFFFGQLSGSRIALYKTLTGLDWIPDSLLQLSKRMLKSINTNFDKRYQDSFIRFTSGFQKGYGPDHYATTLYNSKIALCPAGNLNNAETFRHYEAMRAGSIIITTPMPKFSFYTGSPMIEINHWSELTDVIQDLMSDPQRMEKIHLDTLQWWDTHFEEKSVASYMARAIASLETSVRIPF